jgi:hypothetical protein
MARQIIKQPDGRYAVWCTIAEGFVLHDATREELIEHFLQRERRSIVDNVIRTCDGLDAGKPVYGQFTSSWEELKTKVAKDYAD